MSKPQSPRLTRFLSDFTLGFSDGLTVPFALTAGLSSLGRADTVINAGLAELCAGSISMGIGGYLSALDEVPHSTEGRDDIVKNGDEEELRAMLRDGSLEGRSRNLSDHLEEKVLEQESKEDLIRNHLEPLALPHTTVLEILVALKNRPDGLGRAVCRLQQQNAATEPLSDQLPISPVASGLSISLGYAIGGIIPLLPYCFTSTVGKGLHWSIALCLIVLMAFGSGKSWLLRGEARSVKGSLLEGLQMLVLGSLAASAAVLCVNLVGAGSEPSH
ncbi:uncharacterized protein MAM_02075 [Metarhizium album ARSEF 1941]|uniref:Vacuolar iron transporter Ccc1 n=1 Tax=Metarhizium album (strain ARSEF 1941) TaxID=1081103 RepID=A0A0B2WVK2_METAS|nr:uncharacterized protein MAM_02075 [Metarhizium album ARSEF 1941]KHO00152.1 hypothetical protein MAM_02075 [Metarhizium album ARSEF 1941]